MSKWIVAQHRKRTGFLVAFRLPAYVLFGNTTMPPGAYLVFNDATSFEDASMPNGHTCVRAICVSEREFEESYVVADGSALPVWCYRLLSSNADETLQYIARLATNRGRVEPPPLADVHHVAVSAVREVKAEFETALAAAEARGYDRKRGTLSEWISANWPGRTVATASGTQFASHRASLVTETDEQLRRVVEAAVSRGFDPANGSLAEWVSRCTPTPEAVPGLLKQMASAVVEPAERFVNEVAKEKAGSLLLVGGDVVAADIDDPGEFLSDAVPGHDGVSFRWYAPVTGDDFRVRNGSVEQKLWTGRNTWSVVNNETIESLTLRESKSRYHRGVWCVAINYRGCRYWWERANRLERELADALAKLDAFGRVEVAGDASAAPIVSDRFVQQVASDLAKRLPPGVSSYSIRPTTASVRFVPELAADHAGKIDAFESISIDAGTPGVRVVPDNVQVDRANSNLSGDAAERRCRYLEAKFNELEAVLRSNLPFNDILCTEKSPAKVVGIPKKAIRAVYEALMCSTAVPTRTLEIEVDGALHGTTFKDVAALRHNYDLAMDRMARIRKVIDRYFDGKDAPYRRFATIGDWDADVIDRFFAWSVDRDRDLKETTEMLSKTQAALQRRIDHYDAIESALLTLLPINGPNDGGSVVVQRDNLAIIRTTLIGGKAYPRAYVTAGELPMTYVVFRFPGHEVQAFRMDGERSVILYREAKIEAEPTRWSPCDVPEIPAFPDTPRERELRERVESLEACISEARGALAAAPVGEPKPPADGG